MSVAIMIVSIHYSEPWSQIGSVQSSLDETWRFVDRLEDFVIELSAPHLWRKFGQVDCKIVRIWKCHVDVVDLQGGQHHLANVQLADWRRSR